MAKQRLYLVLRKSRSMVTVAAPLLCPQRDDARCHRGDVRSHRAGFRSSGHCSS